MTTNLIARRHAALLVVLAGVAGCSSKDREIQAQPTPTPTAAIQPSVPITRPPSTVPIAVRSATDEAAASWLTIKDYTFSQRAEFIAGSSRLVGMLAAQVEELNAKRATMTTDTKDWDFAMKEMTASQAYLNAALTELSHATPETWDQEKAKVDEAWQRAQTAYDKVKTTTTS